jgi:LacI family transcriptional regulator
MVRGVEDMLAEQGYVALIGNTDADARRERMVFDQMRARHVDGFVLATAMLRHPILDEAAAADLPVVLMNRTTEGYPFSSVSADNQAGTRAAVAHVASLGHTRIGHIAGPGGISTSVARLRGYQDGMLGSGLEAREDQVIHATAYSVEEGNRCCAELLGRRGDLTAIVAANDMLAIGCYEALDGLGLRCPDDISVIGFNDMPFIDRLRPPLSSIRFPHYQLGMEAAKLLLERIDGEDGPVKILYLAPELVARGSTAPPAPMVALRPALRTPTAIPAHVLHTIAVTHGDMGCLRADIIGCKLCGSCATCAACSV